MALSLWGCVAAGQAIVQPVFAPNEVGKIIATFPQEQVGDKVTLADFQHGQLYVASGDPTVRCRSSWWSLNNPRAPVLLYSTNAPQSKPHTVGFWQHYFSKTPNDANIRIWNYLTRTEAGNNVLLPRTSHLWEAVQAPYIFTGSHGYTLGTKLEVWNVANPASMQKLRQIDTGASPGFQIGSLHALGNLLICSASQAGGVAVYDISDPANPQLIDSWTAGTGKTYTSMVYGSRVYNCEFETGLIRVFDFGNGGIIQPVGTVPLGASVQYVAFKDGRGYVTPGNTNVVVFDATTLQVLQTFMPDGQRMDFIFPFGNMAVVSGGERQTNGARILALAQNPDTAGPAVVYAHPPHLSVNLPVKSRIGFSMSDQIDVTSLTTNSFIVRPVGGQAVAGTYSTQTGLINFSPAAPLQSNTVYEVILPAGGIRDVVGNAMAAEYRLTFRTVGTLLEGPPGLANHWPLDTNAEDVVGFNNGQNWGAGFTAGRVNGAASFSGSVSIGLESLPLPDAFTLAAWVRLDPAATDTQPILGNRTTATNANGFVLYVNTPGTTDGAVRFQTGAGGTNRIAQTAPGAVSTGAWNHLVVVASRTSGTATIYVNGVNQSLASLMVSNFPASLPASLGILADGSRPLKGLLDDVRVYHRALSPAEIVDLVNTFPNSAPLITALTANPGPAPVGTPVTLAVTATDANNDALAYSFDFGDGSPPTAFLASNTAVHTYAGADRFTVIARVRDVRGLVSTNRLLVVHHPLTAARPSASSSILHDPFRRKVWNVNPDNGTVTRIDADLLVKELEVPVGANPASLALRPDGSEVWVACADSDQVAILDAATGAFLQHIGTGYGSQPMGVAFAPNGSAAFVTLMGRGTLRRYHPPSRSASGELPLGGTPRAVAVSADSSRVFVGRFISPVDRGEVWEVNATSLSLTRTFTLAKDLTPDTDRSGRGVPNYLLHLALSPDGRRLWVPSKKDNTDRGQFRDGLPLDHDNTVRSLISQLDLLGNAEDLAARKDVDNHELPYGTIFSPLGDLAFVAFQGNNQLLVFNTASGAQVAGRDLNPQLAPRGLAINAEGTRLFAYNFTTRSITALDIAGLVAGTGSDLPLLAVIPTAAEERLPPTVLRGKQIFHNAADPRMSAQGYLSCATCHLDGGQDGRVWDFTDRGEGLRNTISLAGRRGMGHGPVHWTANFDEIQDFELDIRNGFGGAGFITNGAPNPSLGAPNAGRSADLDALADYIASLIKPDRSPHRNADGTMTASGEAGRQLFAQLACYTCHAGPDFTDSAAGLLRNVGTLKLSSGKRLGQPLTGLDTPTLRGLWNTAPYLHDGSAASLLDVLTTANPGGAHGATGSLTPTQRDQLVAYLLQLDRAELGNGWTGLDVNAPWHDGFTLPAGDRWTVESGGTNLWGVTDSFHFAFREVNQINEVTVRLESLSGPGAGGPPWPARAGLMIRDSLASPAANVFVGLTTGDQWVLQRRSSTGAFTQTDGAVSAQGATAGWLRLVHSAGNFKAFYSVAGAGGPWVQIGPAAGVALDLQPPVLVGVAAAGAAPGGRPVTAEFRDPVVTDPNTRPAIFGLTDMTIQEDQVAGPVSFQISDGQTPPNALTLAGSSSNPALLPDANILFGGSESSRTLTLVPLANASGTAIVTVSVSDGTNLTSASLRFTVTPVDDPPVAWPASHTASAGLAVPIALNGTDVDGDPLSYQITSLPTKGTLRLLGENGLPGSVISGPANLGPNRYLSYTPFEGSSGPDSFTFRVNDGQLDSALATVSFQINGTFRMGVNLNGTAVQIEGNNWLSYTEALAQGLTVHQNPSGWAVGSYTFPLVPAADTDTTTLLKSALVRSGNSFRVAQPLTNGAYTVCVWLIEPLSSYSRSLELRLEGATAATGLGNLPTGHWRKYGPYPTTVADGALDIEMRRGSGDPILFGFAIFNPGAGTNTAPTLSAFAPMTLPRNSSTGPIPFTVGDAQSGPGGVLVRGSSSNPALVPPESLVFAGTGSNRSLTITPAPNQSGSATITVVASDGALATNRTFLLTVSASNQPPTAANLTVAVVGDLESAIWLTGSDPDNDPLSFHLASAPTNGLIRAWDPVAGVLLYAPARGFAGQDSLRFNVSDGASTSALATATIHVLAPTDSNANGLPDAWEAAHGVTDPEADTDGDGFSNRQEYLAHTDPNDPSSHLRIPLLTMTAEGYCEITWAAVGGVRYRVQYTDADGDGAFGSGFLDVPRPASLEICPAPTGVPASMTFCDDYYLLPPAGSGPRMFRVRVVP